ncbi:MAG: response regulator [bacterium]
MNEKVLVVDDEESLRVSLKFRLKSEGFDVEVAEDGEAALEKMKEKNYDVVLLDINMPRMSGTEALTLMRQHFPNTEAIMLTGFADFSTAIECLKMGAKDYLVKPVETTELVTRLRSLLRSKSSEQALYEVQRQYEAMLATEVLQPLKDLQDMLDRIASHKTEKEKIQREDLIARAKQANAKTVERLQALIDFSKTEFGKATLESGSFNPKELAQKLKVLQDRLQ